MEVVSTFPGANSRIYRNEDGEPIGWDYPSEDEFDIDDFYERYEDDDE